MKLAPLFLLALLLLPAAELTFAPDAGLVLTKHFATRASTVTDASDFMIGDQPLPFELGMRSTREFELGVTDTYAASGDGRPQQLERTYDRIIVERTHQDVPDSIRVTGDGERTAPLEGHTVHFRFDADTEEYARSFADADESAQKDWLDDLAEDLDLRALLPEGEVGVDDTWSLEPEALASVLAPGGSFTWGGDSDDDEDDDHLRLVLPGFAPEQLFDALEGDATATLTSLEGDLATITLDFDLEAEADLIDHFTDRLGDEGETQREFEDAEATLLLAGTATLVWNTARHTFESFHLEADLETSLDATWTNSRIEADELTYYSEERGTFTVDATAE
ncbi:MAG: hypothetical protein WD226_01535 [Planctomycetota bacterium]